MTMPKACYLLTYASLMLPTILSTPTGPWHSPNAAVVTRNVLLKRTFPDTGVDFPDTEPHPNPLDQVETAFNDAAELASYVLTSIDTDTTIYPHYFNEADRAGVKSVYTSILGTTAIPQNPSTGNDLLGNILVQRNDVENQCGNPRTLAYMADHNTQKPFIILCPNAFKKKAVTAMNGAEDPEDNPNDAKWYILCDDLNINGHVSYLMNSLGATMLHEYTHYDALTQSIFNAEIIDQPNGYGPFNVYDRLDKSLAKLNSDSYMYYALQVLWTELCQPPNGYAAPRSGIDDNDPDCSGVCQN
ncbi:hypothetical protein P7C71_g3720, partial [Lecanoromycetidae sp. Uapishka_2]